MVQRRATETAREFMIEISWFKITRDSRTGYICIPIFTFQLAERMMGERSKDLEKRQLKPYST